MPNSLSASRNVNDHAVASRLGSAKRATHADGLAGNEAGKPATVDLLKLVEHPEHVLRVGHHIRGRYIGHRADVPCHLAHPATADLLLLPCAEIMRIADHPTLRPTERNIHHGTLPRHPHG